MFIFFISYTVTLTWAVRMCAYIVSLFSIVLFNKLISVICTLRNHTQKIVIAYIDIATVWIRARATVIFV